MLPRTTIWRLKHRSAGQAECVLRERRDGRCSLCVIGGREPSLEVFASSHGAMRHALEIERTMLASGWRQVALVETDVRESLNARRRAS